MNADFTFRDTRDPVDFGRTFVHSDAFRALFRDGMALVEETAAYLDGQGREESRTLPRQAALTYASESMRLTTRLMQIASWLLVQRAVAEGEITAEEALKEKTRVRLTRQESASPVFDAAALPERLKELIGTSVRLHARIVHLDGVMSEAIAAPKPAADSPVAMQQWLIRSAFGGG
ncbi:protease adaptor protein RcdA [Salinarimonas sp. NSM]|uniref:protease adaptor protein RcdA n=1 Tax=Salinarimonas TaxID=690086 RepID=UPI003555D5FA